MCRRANMRRPVFSPDSCAQGRERTAVHGRRAAQDQDARVHPGSARSLGDRDPAASEPARPPPPRPPRSIYGAAFGPGIARRSRGGGRVVNLASGGEVAGEGPAAGGSGATRRASLQLQAGRAARKCGAGASPPPRPPGGWSLLARRAGLPLKRRANGLSHKQVRKQAGANPPPFVLPDLPGKPFLESPSQPQPARGSLIPGPRPGHREPSAPARPPAQNPVNDGGKPPETRTGEPGTQRAAAGLGKLRVWRRRTRAGGLRGPGGGVWRELLGPPGWDQSPCPLAR